MQQFDEGLLRSRIHSFDGLDARVDAVVANLNHTHGNGGALAAQFMLDVDPAVSWFLARNRLPEAEFFRKFFILDIVQRRLGNIGLVKPGNDDLGFALEAPFVALGRLAHIISSGGASLKFDGDDVEVLNLARNFADAAFGERYSEACPYLSWKPWCQWFKGIAWDASFFGLDKRTGIATVLLITDTD